MINRNTESKNKFIGSSAFDDLHKKAFPSVQEKRPNFTRKHIELNNLFGKHVPADQAKKILMIWGMTTYASGMTLKVNASEDEDLYLNGIIANIENLKKNLRAWKSHGTTFQINSLIIGKEPNLDRFLKVLHEMSDFVATCSSNKKFGKGSVYHPDSIKKFGVLSLLHLGLSLGLKHTERNSPLFKFIEITTDLEKSKISKYYLQYNEDEFKLMPEGNTLLFFIYTACRAVLDPSANPRFPAQFITNYSNNLKPLVPQWC